MSELFYGLRQREEAYKPLRNAKRLKVWIGRDMTIQEARTIVYSQLANYLRYFDINTAGYARFTEEYDNGYYAVTYVSYDGKGCILASCEDVADPRAEVSITLFR